MAKSVGKVSKQPLPVETRWNSQFEMIDHFIENWIAIVCLIPELLQKNVYRYVEDIQLKRGASDILEKFQPIRETFFLVPPTRQTIYFRIFVGIESFEKYCLFPK